MLLCACLQVGYAGSHLPNQAPLATQQAILCAADPAYLVVQSGPDVWGPPGRAGGWEHLRSSLNQHLPPPVAQQTATHLTHLRTDIGSAGVNAYAVTLVLYDAEKCSVLFDTASATVLRLIGGITHGGCTCPTPCGTRAGCCLWMLQTRIPPSATTL